VEKVGQQTLTSKDEEGKNETLTKNGGGGLEVNPSYTTSKRRDRFLMNPTGLWVLHSRFN